MSTLTIGIMPQEQTRERAVTIARGEYKPGMDVARVLFPSMNALAEALSDDNQALLVAIVQS